MTTLPSPAIPASGWPDFKLLQVTDLPRLRMQTVQLEHPASGARILHMRTADPLNLFSVTFRTLPPDDTGLTHILEHSVLAGSKRFQVKDPFFEMVKMSMASYINAFTRYEMTVYPVVTHVPKDFWNLAEVYWDAVFHPNLTSETFGREAHHLEFTDATKPKESDLLIKGIVYNEMKGAYSQVDRVVANKFRAGLLPESAYAFDSGGDPEHIPSLTHEALVEYHQTFYHPSNSFIVFYGDLPTEEHLDFLRPRLAEFAKKEIPHKIIRQPRWEHPRTTQNTHPVGPEESTDKHTYIGFGWLIGSITDVEEVMALSVLSEILFGHQGAPMKKALIESQLGEDLGMCGFHAYSLETLFHISLKGSEADRLEKLRELTFSTLLHLANGGITREMVESALHQFRLEFDEIHSGYPIAQMGRVHDAWLFDADPLAYLRAEEALDHIRSLYEADANYFGKLIQKHLLENPHRLDLTSLPDPAWLRTREEALLGHLMQKKASLTPEQEAEILATQHRLEEYENTPNPPEAVAALPQLGTKDLPPEPRLLSTRVEEDDQNGLTFLRTDVFANGVNYLHMALDLRELPEDLLPLLDLYSECIRKMGAAGHNYVAMGERVAAHTGGVSFGCHHSMHATDPSKELTYGYFSTKFLDDQTEPALGVMHDYLFALDPADKPRLKDVLLQMKSSFKSHMASYAVSVGLNRAARHLSPVKGRAELLDGAPMMRQIVALSDGFTDRVDELVEKLLAIRAYLLAPGRIVASFTGSDQPATETLDRLREWTKRARQEHGKLVSAEKASGFAAAGKANVSFQPARVGFATPMQVAYSTQAMPMPPLTHPDAPLLGLGSHQLWGSYILEEIRFKGTAYGASCSYDGLNKQWSLYSYRDPWVTRTLNVFAGLLEYAKKANWKQEELDRSIVRNAGGEQRPLSPKEATFATLGRYLNGSTQELRSQRYRAMLGATAKAVREATIHHLEENAPKAGVCVVSSREKLQAANEETPGAGLELEDVFPEEK